MNQTLILYPLFAMFLLVAAVSVRMGRMRYVATRERAVKVRFYQAYVGDEPEELRVISNHYKNLFEMPVLFYAIVILIYVTEQATPFLLGCAWLYVLLRCAHSYVHLGANIVPRRFWTFIASGLVLTLMWLTLFATLIS